MDVLTDLLIALAIIVAILLIIFLCSIRVVRQTTVMIVERFGSYNVFASLALLMVRGGHRRCYPTLANPEAWSPIRYSFYREYT